MDGEAARTPRFPVKALRVWPGNPRKTLEPTSVDELAAALRRDGEVRVPLFVRALAEPEGEVTHEVLAGQRRLLAAGVAGLAEVPVTVFACDDATALELALQENHSRRDATPLDDAEAIERLFGYGRTAEEVRDRMGARSVRWVERRRSLLRLTPDARAWLRSGELPVGHAEALAALDEASQEEVLKRFRLGGEAGGWRDPGSARNWARELSYAIRALVHAPWELGDKSLPGGACAGCPRRSDAQQDLFGGAVEGEHCLDAACWGGKVAAHWTHAQKAAKRRRLTVIDAPCVSGYSKGTGYDSEYATVAQVPAGVEVPVVALGRDEHGAVYDLVRRSDLAAAMQAREASAPDDEDEPEDDEETPRETPRHIQLRDERRARERARAARLWALAQRPEFARRLALSALAFELGEFDHSDVFAAAGIELPSRFVGHGEASRLAATVPPAIAPALLLAAVASQRLLDPDALDARDLTPDERELVALLEAPEPEAPAEPSPAPGDDAPAPAPAQPPPLPATRVWIAADAWDALAPEEREDLEEPIGGCPVAWEGREGWVTAEVDHAVRVCLVGIADELKVKVHEGDEAPPPVAPTTTELRVSRSEWQKHRSELQDSSTGALHKQWEPEGSDRVAHVERSSPAVAKVIDRARALGIALTVNGKPLAGPMETAAAAKTAKAKKGGGA